MKLKDLWWHAPQATVFVVERDDDFNVTSRKEYHGDKETGEREVDRILPLSYPMYKHVMEVELV